MKIFFQSPLLHFFILGILLFFIYQNVKPVNQESILITTQTIDALVQQRESIQQTPLTAEERELVIQSHIEDEILLREAYNMGIDKGDYRVRKRLLNLMRSSLTEVIPDPSVAQLKMYYEENKERWKTDPSISFESVFFSPTGEKLPKDSSQFIRNLTQSASPLEMGDFSPLGNIFNKMSFQRTASTFGKPFAEKIYSMPLNTWVGPVQSFQGQHYVRTTMKHEPETPSFKDMESYLRTDYTLDQSKERQREKIKKLQKKYEVIVEGKATQS